MANLGVNAQSKVSVRRERNARLAEPWHTGSGVQAGCLHHNGADRLPDELLMGQVIRAAP